MHRCGAFAKRQRDRRLDGEEMECGTRNPPQRVGPFPGRGNSDGFEESVRWTADVYPKSQVYLSSRRRHGASPKLLHSSDYSEEAGETVDESAGGFEKQRLLVSQISPRRLSGVWVHMCLCALW